MTKTTGNSDSRVIDGIRHANELASTGEIELAIQHLLMLIEQVPTASSLHGYLGIILSRAGRLDEAIEHGQQAAQLSPKSEKASFVLFEALTNAGRYVEALNETKRFTALNSSGEYIKLVEQLKLIGTPPQTS